MSAINPTDGIVVMRTHLEEWENIVRWAYGYHAANDLAQKYREGRPNLTKQSRITTLLDRMHHRIEGYLDDKLISDTKPVLSENDWGEWGDSV